MVRVDEAPAFDRSARLDREEKILHPASRLAESSRPYLRKRQEIDGDAQGSFGGGMREERIESKIGRHPAVDEPSTVDLDWWKEDGQGSARPDMFGSDRPGTAVEDDILAGFEVDRVHREPALIRIQAIEIHLTLKRSDEVAGVVNRQVGKTARRDAENSRPAKVVVQFAPKVRCQTDVPKPHGSTDWAGIRQKRSRLASGSPDADPAISAPLIAPIEVPIIQSGSKPQMHSPS